MNRHGDLLSTFLDLEAHPTTTPVDADLSSWCGFDPPWRETDRFIVIGADASGSQFAVWSTQPTLPIVYFGSEGGYGVLAPDPLSWIRALTYAPLVEEYPSTEPSSSRLSLPQEGPTPLDDGASTAQAAARYKAAVELDFGPMPPFSDLVTVTIEIRTAFSRIMDDAVQRFQAQREQQREADQRARLEVRRQRAEGFAASSILPAGWQAMSDGTTFPGRCPGCGAETSVRLVLHDEHAFALCSRCYFSSRW